MAAIAFQIASLTELWADGPQTLHGMFLPGFPNCFMLGPTQGGFTPNFPHMLDEVSTHLAYVLREAKGRGATIVEPTAEAVDEWVATIDAHPSDTPRAPCLLTLLGQVQTAALSFSSRRSIPG